MVRKGTEPSVVEEKSLALGFRKNRKQKPPKERLSHMAVLPALAVPNLNVILRGTGR